MRERILQTNPLWSPYPDGRIREACRDIERDASFFMGGFGEEFDLPPLPPYEALRNAQFIPIAVGDHVGEYGWATLRSEDEHRAARIYAGNTIVKDRLPHFTDDELERAGWPVLHLEEPTAKHEAAPGEGVLLANESFIANELLRDELREKMQRMEEASIALKLGLAATEAVRVSEPFDMLEMECIPSDGIPLPIGADESTTPKTPPKGSTAIYTESERITWTNLLGASRHGGMDW
jgi:hypothetical protein